MLEDALSEQDFHNYRALLDKVEAFHQGIVASYGKQIACRRGCHDCCTGGLTFLPVEFCYLHQGLRNADRTVQTLLRSKPTAGTGHAPEEPCLLLHQGACLLYKFRPLICRTHGLPLVLREGGSELRDCCPKNFVSLPLLRLPRDALLELEVLTTMLVAVNLVFSSRLGIDPGIRRPLTELPGFI